MKNKSKQGTFIFMVMLVAVIIAIANVGAANYHSAPVLVSYLSVEKDITAADTGARGKVVFYLSEDGEELHYKLNVSSIKDVTSAHIHLTPMEEQGRVVVFLFDLTDRPRKGNFNGAVSEGVITAADLVGPLVGGPVSALLREMEQGHAFINVHTREHPRGYLSGQIVDPYLK